MKTPSLAESEELDDEALGDRLWQALVDYADAASYDREVMARLTPALQAYWATELLEFEVTNGGFNQYFFNLFDELAEDAVAGYEFFGLSDHAALVREAIAVAEREEPVREAARRVGTPEAVFGSYDSRLAVFDSRLCDDLGDTLAVRIQYLRDHPDQVFHDVDPASRYARSLSSRAAKRSLAQVPPPGFRIGASYDVCFCSGGSYLASSGRYVTVWNVDERRPVLKSSALSHPSHQAFSPDESRLIIKSTSGSLALIDLATGDILVKSRGEVEGCEILFSPDSRYLIEGDWAGHITVRDGTDLTVVHREDHENSMVVSASADRMLGTFAFAVNGREPLRGEVNIRGWPFSLASRDVVATSSSGFVAVAVSPEADRVAIQEWNGALRVVTLDTGREVARSKLSMGGTGSSLAWSPDSAILAVLEDGCFTFRDVETLETVASYAAQYPSSVSFSADGGLVALGSWESGVVLPWDVVVNDSGLDQR